MSSLPYEVVHCSSWDEGFSPEQLVMSSPGNQAEPKSGKCKGWQTTKCPDYPQDLIIHLLSGASRISKVQILSHHFMIATKIDVYIGVLKDPQDLLDDIAPDTPPVDDEDNMLIEFTRLGYVSFENNARAQFRARELKSIKINGDGEYVRLVIRNCHHNRLNTYNQVSILALNVMGQPLHLLDKHEIACSSSSNYTPQARHLFDDSSVLSSSTRRTSVSSNQSQLMRMPTGSVAEMELQRWSTALLQAEEEAVQGESYQIAKTYKYLGDKLSRFTKILSDLEMGKRHAVETKDYDEAEKIKDDIQEIRQAAEAMLKHANVHITDDDQVILLESSEALAAIQEVNDFISEQEQYRQSSPYMEYHRHDSPSQQDFLDDTVVCSEPMMPPLAKELEPDHWDLHMPSHRHHHYLDEHEEIHIPASYSSKVVPTQPTIIPLSPPSKPLKEDVDPDTIPEPIMDEERIPYTLPIHIFGEEVVACVLSVKAKCRGRGLGQIEEKIQAVGQLVETDQLEEVTFMIYFDEPYEDEEYADVDKLTSSLSHFINASLMMIQEAIMDSREPIVSLAITVWHQLNDVYKSCDLETKYIIEWTERAFSGLLKRTGDTNTKIKTAATKLVLSLVKDYSQPPYALMPLYVCKPERMIHNYKEAKCRVELVEATVKKFGVSSPSSTDTKTKKKAADQVCLQDLMDFVVAYLNHSHEDVKEAAIKLVITISDQVGFQLVSTYIDESLRLSLTETVKKLVDKDDMFNKTSANVTETQKKSRLSKESKNKSALSELRALTVVKSEKKSSATTRPSTAKKTTTTTTKAASAAATADKKSADKKTARSTTATPTARKTKTPTAKSNTSTKKAATTEPSKSTKPVNKDKVQQDAGEDNSTLKGDAELDENSVCIFCDEVNPAFNEDTLIKHYYNTCPVLTNCPMCQIITEVSTLNEHMLLDCDRKHLIKECSRCHQAIPVEQWLQHTLKKTCNNDPNKVQCPLCLIEIDPPNEIGWKSHLMTGDGCPKLKKSRSPVKKTSTVPVVSQTQQVKKKTTVTRKP
ncbi:Centrosomal protein [Choanephora cucurbitarum]|uniref:Centrosomal protein n=1 Tax=Choanephora cucurbitarum TaxID=101091 RepID=A0A1C7N123_9FUNG|nr:Centrosomal protein [Choanephora cucurbitarum]